MRISLYKLLIPLLASLLSGCSIVLPNTIPENPDKENFDTEYVNPDFSAEEEALRRGE